MSEIWTPEKSAEFARTLRVRNELIPQLLREPDKFSFLPQFLQTTIDPRSFTPQDRVHDFIVNRLIAPAFAASSRLEGEGNLRRAIEEKNKGKRVTFTPAHFSDADHASLRLVLERGGYKEVADSFMFLSGVKMKERWFIRVFMGGENSVDVVSAPDMADIDAAKLNANFDDKTKEEVSVYRRNANVLNLGSIKKAEEWAGQGGIVVIYPQGGRAKGAHAGLIGAGQPRTERIIGRLGDVVLPLVIDGAIQAFPPGKMFRFRRMHLRLTVGSPYEAAELQDPAVLNGLKELGAKPIDLVMTRIGRLRWDLVDPECMDLYRRIDERFPSLPLAA